MFRKLAASLLVLTLSVTLVSCVVDYCDQGLCEATGYNHITCDATGNFLPSCPNDARVYPISTINRKQILDLHNKYRNKIAGGNEPGFSPATRMTTMKWNQELADYAELNVRRCVFEHDCHNTPQMKYAGQNLYYEASSGSYEDVHSFIAEAIKSWYDEKQFATQENIESCCGLDSGPQAIPHFLELVNSKANQVGCAISQYVDSDGKKTYMSCDYSFTIVEGFSMYKSGRPASECKTGVNTQFPSLCSPNEHIDPNDIY